MMKIGQTVYLVWRVDPLFVTSINVGRVISFDDETIVVDEFRVGHVRFFSRIVPEDLSKGAFAFETEEERKALRERWQKILDNEQAEHIRNFYECNRHSLIKLPEPEESIWEGQ